MCQSRLPVLDNVWFLHVFVLLYYVLLTFLDMDVSWHKIFWLSHTLTSCHHLICNCKILPNKFSFCSCLCKFTVQCPAFGRYLWPVLYQTAVGRFWETEYIRCCFWYFVTATSTLSATLSFRQMGVKGGRKKKLRMEACSYVSRI